jgi:hypothetical protein
MAEQLMSVREQPVQFVGIVVNHFHFYFYFKPSVPGFPAAAHPLEHPAAKSRRSTRRDCLIRLSAYGVVLPSFGRLDVIKQVDVKRAPYPNVDSWLSAASSNTRVPPLIRPYPPRHHILPEIHPPKWDGILVVSIIETTHQAEDLGGGSAHRQSF